MRIVLIAFMVVIATIIFTTAQAKQDSLELIATEAQDRISSSTPQTAASIDREDADCDGESQQTIARPALLVRLLQPSQTVTDVQCQTAQVPDHSPEQETSP